MNFESNKVAFGRHESFALRFGWLTKGFQAFENNKNIFTSDDSVVVLGVGKNMVHSIRHWLKAAQLIKLESGQKDVSLLGNFLFSAENGRDPYLEDEATIWLLHWLLATNPTQATSWFWFFNLYHKPEFTSQEAGNALADFAKDKISAKFSVATVKKDCAVLLRSYAQSKASKRTSAEEALDSPLSLLRLISYSSVTKSFQSRLAGRENLPMGIFGFAIADYLRKYELASIPIEEIMYSRDERVAPGLLFRISENGLLTKLEQLVDYIPGIFKVDETAGIHQLFRLKDIEPIDYLKKHYSAALLEESRGI